MMTAIVLGLSVGVQLVAAGLAMRLMTSRQNRLAALLIISALFLMAVRRVITLTHTVMSPGPDDAELGSESLALAASLVLASGLALFETRRAEDAGHNRSIDSHPSVEESTQPFTSVELSPATITQLMPLGYACHRIVLDANGQPVDYVFLDVNRAFEEQTGLSRAKIIGQPVTKVLPTIVRRGRNWIGDYGHVAQTGEVLEFEDYAAPLQRWYKVIAYSPQRGYFVTLIQDITQQKILEVSARRHGSTRANTETTHTRYLSSPAPAQSPE